MSVLEFARKKNAGEKLAVVTCYDYPGARFAAATPIDALLVGDSVAMVVHGHATTIPATLEMMTLHTAAVARGAAGTFVIADLPFLAHRRGIERTIDAADALLKAGAQAVKLEGAQGNAATVRHLVESGIPVVGHVGLTPQFIHRFGGFKVQGRDDETAAQIRADAATLEAAGCFALVVEGVPASLGATLAAQRRVPIIGIGAGPGTDGQVLVWHDLLGITEKPPKFARRFGDIGAAIEEALRTYADAVKSGAFPSENESYR